MAGRHLVEIEEERHEQCRLGFTDAKDDQLTPSQWVAILARHVGLAADDGGGFDPERFRRQMKRVAATALAAMESFDRVQPAATPKQHRTVPKRGATPNAFEGNEGRRPYS